MPLATEVVVGLGDIALDGDLSPVKGGSKKSPAFRPMYCGQTASWIKMPLGTEVGLGPSHIVLDGDPAPSKRGTAPSPPIFGRCLLWPNGWMDQYATWYEGRRRLPAKKEHSPPFSAHVCCGQMAGLIKISLGTEVDLGPGHIALDGEPAPPPPRGTAANFRPMYIVPKRSPISATADHLP